MFSIIIPNYNNGPWLDRLFQSIKDQTYQDFEIIFIDDVSHDNSFNIAEKWKGVFGDRRFLAIPLGQKRYNGGARNVGLQYRDPKYKYTLFMDSDDMFADDKCLAEIVRLIEGCHYPDLIRLSYIICIGEREGLVNLGNQTTVDMIVNNENVACWTKCVKSEKVVPFPENTLMEDVIQHIKQLDAVDSIAATRKGIIKWNRNNSNSCSNNTELQDGKWRSSLYRYFADLLDLRVNKPACQKQLQYRIDTTLDNIKHDRFLQ